MVLCTCNPRIQEVETKGQIKSLLRSLPMLLRHGTMSQKDQRIPKHLIKGQAESSVYMSNPVIRKTLLQPWCGENATRIRRKEGQGIQPLDYSR